MTAGSYESEDAKANLIDKAIGLFSQQIWCWGQDIKSSHGNLLVQFGCQRIETPPGRNESSIYRFELNPSSRVMLRGFGVFFGDDHLGGLFLHRFSFDPRLTSQADLIRLPWSSSELPALKKPRADQGLACKRLLLALANWIGSYENWVLEQYGASYREESLFEWNPKNNEKFAGEEMAAIWNSLGPALADETVDIF